VEGTKLIGILYDKSRYAKIFKTKTAFISVTAVIAAVVQCDWLTARLRLGDCSSRVVAAGV